MESANIETTFCELRAKEVVNASDGRRLGRIIDLVLSENGGSVKGIVAPYSRRGFLGKGQDVFIPWRCIQKIGEDVILVEIRLPQGEPPRPEPRPERCPEPPPPCGHEPPPCDGKCDRCPSFDCEFRWKR